jgi:hypothetical protein
VPPPPPRKRRENGQKAAVGSDTLEFVIRPELLAQREEEIDYGDKKQIENTMIGLEERGENRRQTMQKHEEIACTKKLLARDIFLVQFVFNFDFSCRPKRSSRYMFLADPPRSLGIKANDALEGIMAAAAWMARAPSEQEREREREREGEREKERATLYACLDWICSRDRTDQSQERKTSLYRV